MSSTHDERLRSALRGLASRQLQPHALNVATPLLVRGALLGAGAGLAGVLLADASLFALPIGALAGGALLSGGRFVLANLRGRRSSIALSLLKEADRGARADDLLLTVYQQPAGAFADALNARAQEVLSQARNVRRAPLKTQPLVAFGVVLVIALTVALTPLLIPDVSQWGSGPVTATTQAETHDPADPLRPAPEKFAEPGGDDGPEGLLPGDDPERSGADPREASGESGAESDTPGGDVAPDDGVPSDAPGTGKGEGSAPSRNNPGEARGDATPGSTNPADTGQGDERAPAPTDKPIAPPKQPDFLNRPPRKTTGASGPEHDPESRDANKTRKKSFALDPWSNERGERKLISTLRKVYDPEANEADEGPRERASGLPEGVESPERKLQPNAALTDEEREWARKWAERAENIRVPARG